ncbi:MAG: translation initiation factor IF-2 [Rhizobiales bacterium]|nr:translation initiation factor IF-2 [Hyphomicrobiales bacterium]
MSDTNDTSENKGSDGKKTLSLKRTVGGTVRQSFSHGRTNTVVVETKRRRFSTPGVAAAPESAAPAVEPRIAKPRVATPPPAPQPKPAASGGSGGAILRQLSSDEKEARAKALAFAREREEERRALELEEEKARQSRSEQEQLDAKRREEAEARRKQEEEAREAAEIARVKEDASNVAMTVEGNPAAPAQKRMVDEWGGSKSEEAKGGIKAYERPKAAEPKPARRIEERRRGKLTLTNALDDGERERSLASIKRQREREKARAAAAAPREKISRDVVIPETITIAELANRMAERAVDVVKLLMQQGQMMTASDIIDSDLAQLIAEEMGHKVTRVAESDIEGTLFDKLATGNDDEAVSRPPVVTIMGHVDHGKTSLLDAIRNANVVSGEAGGITQHIGAYQVEQDGAKITFIDTPGHAAFTAMRARGAQATDIVVLVVAADDGVMPQTIEAIHHAKAAKVPIIVAVNKIDKPSADPSRVRNELLHHEVFVETMGGDVLEVEVSALKGTNLDKLLEVITLQAEILDLKANVERAAQGTVIEAKLDKGRGPVATVLVQAGTLRNGDIVVAGASWGKVRALIDDKNEQVKEALPSKPVEILGFNSAPEAGDRFAVVESEAKAREIAAYRERQNRDKAMAKLTTQRGSLEQMMNQLQTSELKEIPLVVKGDVQGSIEAIIGSIDKLGTKEVAGRIIHSAVGGITESDITLAAASNAPIIGFNVRANKQARDLAAAEGIEIRYYNIIYDLVDDVKAVMSGMLTPERRETFIGNASILEVFNITKVGKVAGCRVTDGIVERGAGVRLIRDDVVIHEGQLSTLKRFKDEVKEVHAGQECGMAFTNYQDMRAGDVIECFRVEHVERSL